MLKIYTDQYIFYGLNRYRQFLSIPSCNECGERPRIVTKTKEDLESFSVEVLKGHDCFSCALFYVFLDGTYGAFFKIVNNEEYDEDEDEDTIEFALCKVTNSDRHLFAELDAEFRLCCYSLLVEVEDGVYEVCK